MKIPNRVCLTLLSLFVYPAILSCNGFATEKDGGIIVYPSASGPVVFSHQAHGARGAGFSCGKCHLSPSTKALAVTMDEIRQGKACGVCHDGKTRGSQGQPFAASIRNCTACHMPASDIIIKLNRMDPVAFSHMQHLAADAKEKISMPFGFSCCHCHPIPFEQVSKNTVGMEVPHKTGGCAACHNGRKRKDGRPAAFAANTRCLTCHKPPAVPAQETRQ